MIKANRGEVEVYGELKDVFTELWLIVKSLRKEGVPEYVIRLATRPDNSGKKEDKEGDCSEEIKKIRALVELLEFLDKES